MGLNNKGRTVDCAALESYKGLLTFAVNSSVYYSSSVKPV